MFATFMSLGETHGILPSQNSALEDEGVPPPNHSPTSASGLERFCHAHRINNDVVGLGGCRGGRDFLQTVGIQRARPAPLHLFEVVRAFNISHEEEAFEGLYVRAGGD